MMFRLRQKIYLEIQAQKNTSLLQKIRLINNQIYKAESILVSPLFMIKIGRIVKQLTIKSINPYIYIIILFF